MELRIVPSSDMNIKLQGKTIGKLEGLVIDVSTGGGLLGIPKVRLEISFDRSVFSDQSGYDLVVSKVKKFKFLEIISKK